jgi:hypothetical protein
MYIVLVCIYLYLSDYNIYVFEYIYGYNIYKTVTNTFILTIVHYV